MSSNQLISDLKKVYGIDTALADSLSVGLFYADINGKCLYVNSKWIEISGLEFNEALGNGWLNGIHSDDREEVISEWNKSIRNDQKFASEYRFQRDDKNIIWVLCQANKYKDKNGEVSGYVGTITDITERKNSETSLYLLAKGFSVTNSSEFFHSFSMHLSEVLDVDYVVVSEIVDDSCDLVKSVVVNYRGEILDPIEYSLKGTPCETVMGKSIKGYECNIQKKFPEFALLKVLGVEGYVGTPLFNSSNKPIGIIAVLNSKPIKNIKSIENVLQIYAVRASAELERKQKEQLLHDLNKELEFKQFTVDRISECIFWTDINAKINDVNEAACQSLGYTREELLMLSIPDIDPQVSFEGWKKHWKKTKAHKGLKIFESIHKTKEGHIFPIEINVNHIEFGGYEYHCSIVRNISERKASDKERETNLSLQKAIFEATADGIMVTNKDQYIATYNQNFVKIWGLLDKDIKGKNDDYVIQLVTNQLKDSDAFVNRIIDIYKKPQEDTFDILELNDGRILERVSRPQYLDGEIVGRVWNFSDITEKHRLSEQLSYQANHDPLTGLVNRREFEKRLVRVLSSRDEKSEHAMCYMDLDNFKQINDVCGHIAGDYLLKQIADLFQQNTRARDTLARLGGDEFGLIMEHCSVERAKKIAANFISLINDSNFKWEDRSFDIGVSIGIVKIDNSSNGMLDTMKNADVACYAAKKSGRNCIHVSNA